MVSYSDCAIVKIQSWKSAYNRKNKTNYKHKLVRCFVKTLGVVQFKDKHLVEVNNLKLMFWQLWWESSFYAFSDLEVLKHSDLFLSELVYLIHSPNFVLILSNAVL